MKKGYILFTIICFPFLIFGQSGSSVSFDGMSSRVQIEGIAPENKSALTIEAWIFTKSKTITNGYSEIIRQDIASGSTPDFLLSFQDESVISRILSFGLKTTTGYQELDVEIDTTEFMNTWVHIAATYDGSEMKVYQNGNLLGSTEKTGNILYSPAAGLTNIGCASYFETYSEYFEGYIDEFRIWSTARSLSEIMQTMNSPLSEEYYSTADSGLIGYWQFDELTGNTALDLSPSGNDGTLVNSEYADGNSLPVELTEFTVNSKNGNIFLKWSTASESNNVGWEIEYRQRTMDNGRQKNIEFRKIGFVFGRGTTSEKQNYIFPVSSFQSSGSVLEFRLKQMDSDGKINYSKVLAIVLTPESFSLSQNYPNPFNPTSVIQYTLASSVSVDFAVFNMLGQRVLTLVDATQPAGFYSVTLDGSHLTSGTYFYVLNAGQFHSVKKFLLAK